MLCDAKIEINRKYLESIGLEKAALELKKQALPSKKEVKQRARMGNAEDAAVTLPKNTRSKQKCASAETTMAKKKRIMAKQRNKRKKLRAMACAAAKEDNNTKLDQELKKLAQE
ncbi:hypothetical protein ACA910_010092 [Epithemia clementina (nom. ined.)]